MDEKNKQTKKTTTTEGRMETTQTNVGTCGKDKQIENPLVSNLHSLFEKVLTFVNTHSDENGFKESLLEALFKYQIRGFYYPLLLLVFFSH